MGDAAAATVEAQECLICVEDLDAMDLNLHLCPCEFKICKVCFDKLAIEAESSANCPGCRRPYELNRITARLKVSWIGYKTQMGSTKIGRLSFLLTQMLSFFKPDAVIPQEFFTSPVSLSLFGVNRQQDMISALARLRMKKFNILDKSLRVQSEFYSKVGKCSNLEEVFKRSCDLFSVHIRRPEPTPDFRAQVMEHATVVLDAMLSWSTDEFLQDELTELVNIVHGDGGEPPAPPQPEPAPPMPEGEDEQEHLEYYRRLEQAAALRRGIPGGGN